MSKRPRRSSEKVVYDLKRVKVIGEPFQTKKKLSMLLFSFALSVAVLAQTDSDEEPDYQSRLDRVTDGPYLIWPWLLEEADRTSVAVVPKFDEDGQILEEYGMGFITWEAADAMCRRPAPAPAPAAAVAATPAQAEPAAEAKPLSRAQQRRRPAAKKPQGLKKGFFKTEDEHVSGR